MPPPHIPPPRRLPNLDPSHSKILGTQMNTLAIEQETLGTLFYNMLDISA